MDDATTSDVLDLARLACEKGASFDVAYDVDGSVRVSLYPQAPENHQVEQVLHFDGVLSPEQYQRLKDTLSRDIDARHCRQG